MILLVDMPKSQSGHINAGNTAWKFFRNANLPSNITGMSVNLIKQFWVILECLNCAFAINIKKFEKKEKPEKLRNCIWKSIHGMQCL